MFLILEFLKIIDGITKIFNYLFGNINIGNEEHEIYILTYLFENNTISNTFNCIILISIMIGGIYCVISIIKNMYQNDSNISEIISKFIVSLISMFITSVLTILIVIITSKSFVIIADIFNINTNTSIAHNILDICVFDYNNYYNINDVNFSLHSINDLLGDYVYETYQLMPIEWKNNGIINPNTFLYIPCFIASLVVLYSYLYSAVMLSKRLYEIILLYLIMPISIYTITIDNGNRFKIWISLLMKKIFITYIIYISLFVFSILYEYIIKRYVHGYSYEIRLLNLIFMMGGSLIIPLSQKLLITIFGDISISKNIVLLKKILKKN